MITFALPIINFETYKPFSENPERKNIPDILNEFSYDMFNPKDTTLSGKIRQLYDKSKQEFPDDLNPPDFDSLIRALRFLQLIGKFKEIPVTVSTLGDGGFSLRFQKNYREYVDVDIYNGDNTIVFLHSQTGKEVEAFDLSIQETANKLKEVIGG